MQRSDMIPLGDIVGADALRVLATRDPRLFSDIINRALDDPPRTEVLPAGSILEVSLHGNALGSFETPQPSTLTANLHPWLVLAQVAMLPLDGPADDVSPNGRIIATVGSHPGLLRRVGDERWREMEGFHFHNSSGKGSVPCLNNGVIEPIGQAIIAAFHARPGETLSMTEHAVAEDLFHLAWRLHTAAREVTSATDSEAAEAAEVAVAMTDEYFRQQYKQILHEAPDGGSDGDPDDVAAVVE